MLKVPLIGIGVVGAAVLIGYALAGLPQREAEGLGEAVSAGDRSGVPAALDRPPFSTAGWKTDFSRANVPLSEFQSGGPPKDGIPPVDKPKFVDVSASIDWLKENEPVIGFVAGGEARAYPLQILMWHEIVNDTVGGVPVALTFCPLCNTAIAFDRRLEGRAYDFGTSGKLRNSDLVMYDRQTESWWQQITGEAIVGERTGKALKMLPAAIVSWKDFKAAYPKGKVLSRDTGFSRSYGSNPYTGYDDVRSSPFLFSGRADGRLAPMERVVTVSATGEDVAYLFKALQDRRVINDRAGGVDVVVFWAGGTASALDSGAIAESRDIGATNVFEATIEGKQLTFSAAAGGNFIDKETGTTWNLLGQGLAGPLAGRELTPVTHANHFWFSWAAFKPGTRIYQ